MELIKYVFLHIKTKTIVARYFCKVVYLLTYVSQPKIVVTFTISLNNIFKILPIDLFLILFKWVILYLLKKHDSTN